MSVCPNCFLCNKNFVTNRALLTFGKTGRGTSSINCGNSFFCMIYHRNYCLSNKNFVTNRAVLTFSKTCCCASSRNSRINNLGVTKSVNCCLCSNDFTALNALRAISKAGCCTSSRITFNNFCFGMCASRFTFVSANVTDCIINIIVCMSYHRNFALSNKNRFTNGAVLTFGKTGLIARGSNSIIDYFSVTLSSNDFLSNKNCVTNGAVLAFSLTSCSTCSCNSFIDYYGVIKRRTGICDCYSITTTNVAKRSLCSVLCTSCIVIRSVSCVCMIYNVEYVGFKVVASGAIASFFAFLCARRSRCYYEVTHIVTELINCFGIGIATSAASVSLNAFILTGRISCDYTVVPSVTESISLVICVSITTVTSMSCVAFVSTCRSSYNRLVIVSVRLAHCIATVASHRLCASSFCVYVLVLCCGPST